MPETPLSAKSNGWPFVRMAEFWFLGLLITGMCLPGAVGGAGRSLALFFITISLLYGLRTALAWRRGESSERYRVYWFLITIGPLLVSFILAYLNRSAEM